MAEYQAGLGPLGEYGSRALEKRVSGTDDPSFYISLEDWRPGSRRPLEVRVTKNQYNSVAVGDPVVVTTGQGRFGWEWLKDIQPDEKR